MIPTPFRLYPKAGTAVEEYDTRIPISNWITMMLTANRTPTRTRSLQMSDFAQWINTATTVYAQDPKDEFLRIISDKEDFKAPHRLFVERYKEVVAALNSPVERQINNVSHQLKEDLLRYDWVEEVLVDTPALGYPRPHYSLTIDPVAGWNNPPYHVPSPVKDWNLNLFDKSTPQPSMPSPTSPGGPSPASTSWPKGMHGFLAYTACLADSINVTNSLMPRVTDMALKPGYVREPVIGAMLLPLNQMDWLTATGLLWSVQHIAYFLALSHKDYLWRASYARQVFPFEAPIIDAAIRIREEIRNKFPLHPLFQSWINMWQETEADTIYGTVPLHLVPYPGTLPAIAPVSDTFTLSSASSVAQEFMINALAEVERFRDVVGPTMIMRSPMPSNADLIALRPSGAASWPYELLKSVGTLLDESTIRRSLSYDRTEAPLSTAVKLLEWLSLNDRFVSKWPEIIRKLGWSGSGVAGTKIKIDLHQADFVLTDGDGYTSDPLDVLTGLRPCYSLGNKKAYGLGLTWDNSFNLGPVQDETQANVVPVATTWSVMVVQGKTSALIGDEALAMRYQPMCMNMGEDSTGSNPIEMVYMHEAPNSTERAMITKFWDNKLSAYGSPIKMYYTDPVTKTSDYNPTTLMYRLTTSWDTYVTVKAGHATPAALHKLLLDCYGEHNQECPPIRLANGAISGSVPLTDYRYRKGMFKYRFPVRTIVHNSVFWVDTYGRITEKLSRRGLVFYGTANDSAIPINASTARLEEYVNQWPVRQVGIPSVDLETPPPPFVEVHAPTAAS